MEKFKCCFCGQEFEGYGNNPYPANKDENARCCDTCNWTVVVPARLHALGTSVSGGMTQDTIKNKEDLEMIIAGVVSSKRGFYVGDICYVLSDEVYDEFWGEVNGYESGVFTEPKTGFKFAVSGTAYGDGFYVDNYGNASYPVDAGVIGLVPMELVEDEERLTCGKYFEGAGDAQFYAEDGWFKITLPNGKVVVIDTAEEEEEEDDYEEDEWDHDWEDDDDQFDDDDEYDD